MSAAKSVRRNTGDSPPSPFISIKRSFFKACEDGPDRSARPSRSWHHPRAFATGSSVELGGSRRLSSRRVASTPALCGCFPINCCYAAALLHETTSTSTSPRISLFTAVSVPISAFGARRRRARSRMLQPSRASVSRSRRSRDRSRPPKSRSNRKNEFSTRGRRWYPVSFFHFLRPFPGLASRSGFELSPLAFAVLMASPS